jgi:hypothetical protein
MEYRDLIRQPCPSCGSTHFAWGRFAEFDDARYYEDGGFVHNLTSPAFEVRARRCRDCGNLQLFTLSDEQL